MDEIWEQAAQARRALKAAAGGKKTPAARPGALRDKVLGHLRGHPASAFTPHEIHKVLGNSSQGPSGRPSAARGRDRGEQGPLQGLLERAIAL
jgi:hypothetical protein